jgi:glycosyltransferase involved in cell wall biosynthesis
MAPEISVITCAHNSRREYLEKVLTALQNQTLDKVRWEYLLVDNASDSPLISSIDLSWHPFAKHFREEKLGLTHARLSGVRQAIAPVLVFVDDDNVLDPDYLEKVLEISEAWPMLGAWGGQTRPIFEVEPPEWTRQFWTRLVIREFETDRWTNQPGDAAAMPCGAGMCVRRKVANYYAELHANGRRGIVLDRSGQSLVSGGDSDLAICACDLGLGMGLFAALKLTHLIPGDRLTEDYLERLLEGLAFSDLVLKSFRANQVLPPQRKLSTTAADALRLLLRNRRDRRFFRAVRRGEANAARVLRNGL